MQLAWRSVQQCGVSARTYCSDCTPVSRSHVHAHRCGSRGNATACRPSREARHGTAPGRARHRRSTPAACAGAGSGRDRRAMRCSKLLRDGAQSGRPARCRRRQAPQPSQGHAHDMSDLKQYAVAADTVFDGKVVHRDSAVLVEDSHIVWLGPSKELRAEVPVHALPRGAWLAPGFIDLQVNGGGDVLFNDEPTPAGIARIAAAHRRFGTTSLMPTLISDTADKMRAALAAIRDYAGAGVLGIHFEGPFLSPEKVGAHDPAMIRVPGPQDLDLLTSSPHGTALVTLAPERVETSFIEGLVQGGVRVALGHSMATYAQTKEALAAGLTGFTHLFNAMRPLASREPGPIAAALESPDAWYGMIVDGVHVAPAMLRLALRGSAHPMLVTDAMPPVGGSKPVFTLSGLRITAQGASCTTP